MSGIRFLLGDTPVDVNDVSPTTTLLQFLRDNRGLTGTKEGCAEGDCGACTVLVGEKSAESVRYRAINACIAFIPTLHGKQVITVEHLAENGAHGVQHSMLRHHASQCGFCTPGFVMSIAGLRDSNSHPSQTDITDALAGNLCRCTGYGPILEAARDDNPGVPERLKDAMQSAAEPAALAYQWRGRRYFAPTTLDEACQWLTENPSACVLAGGTDVGLWVTKQRRTLDPVLYVGNIVELKRIETDDGILSLGAGVTYADARETLSRLHPEWNDLIRRIGGTQVWNAGTIGGNIANGSPIGDTPPALIAMNASVELVSVRGSRTLPLEDFFIDYGKQDRANDELVHRILIPRPTGALRFYKISKRFEQDISAVMGAFAAEIRDNCILSIRIAYGGMAATPKRAEHLEEYLTDRLLDDVDDSAIRKAIDADFQPLTDLRASKTYRASVAANLVRKFILDAAEADIPHRLLYYQHIRSHRTRALLRSTSCPWY